MGKYNRELTEELIQFIGRQQLFFVSTAPSDEGRINLSPKGYESLVVMSPHAVGYVDYAGSGNETANHIKDNGKITLMWCSFGEIPLIFRVYGHGKVIEKQSAEYAAWMETYFPVFDQSKARQIIVIEVEATQMSCGSGVPFMEYKGDRANLGVWTDRHAAKGTLDEYIEKNAPRLETKFPLKRGGTIYK